MPASSTAQARCQPGRHHLTAQVNVRASVVLSPHERTFEFWGDVEPSLVIVDVSCEHCDLGVAASGAVPADVRDELLDALAEASIMQPLDDNDC